MGPSLKHTLLAIYTAMVDAPAESSDFINYLCAPPEPPYHVDSSMIRLSGEWAAGMSPRLGQRRIRPGIGGNWPKRASDGCLGYVIGVPLSLSLAPTGAVADIGATTSDLVLIVVVVAAGALALAGGLWGFSEHQSTLQLRRSLRSATAKARALLSARDAWLTAGRESLLVWGPDMSEPLNFGKGAELLQACLNGPESLQLSAALDALGATGAPFALTCNTAEFGSVSARGRPSGGYLTLFLEAQDQSAGDARDWRAALNAIPVPAWIRGKDLALSFVNRAFLTALGTTEEAALTGN